MYIYIISMETQKLNKLANKVIFIAIFQEMHFLKIFVK